MTYIKNIEDAKKVIISLYPEFKDSSFISDNSGWCNFVVKVDKKFIFRFPRDEESFNIVETEDKVLSSLFNQLPKNIQIPQFIYKNMQEQPFVGYKMIEGNFLTGDAYHSLSNDEKDALAKNMASFLTKIHTIDYQKYKLDVIDPIANYQQRYKQFQEICFKYLNKEEQIATIQLFENYFSDETMTNYIPTPIHGDLSEDHILLTTQGIGIIDFGDIRVFDPACDFIWAYLFDEDCFDRVFQYYQGNKDNYFKHRIRDFYIKRVGFYGIVYGDETNDIKLIQKEIKRIRKNLLNK